MAFDSHLLDRLGWRQGAILGPAIAEHARTVAPAGVAVSDRDWLVVTSHDCDLLNDSLEKEPVVEVLRAEVVRHATLDRQQRWGRNPRALQIAVPRGASQIVLRCRVHERWTLPRQLLADEPPLERLDQRTTRMIAEWLAKRYIRAAFPTEFDRRWRPKQKDWVKLLGDFSSSIQGVYLRLSTQDELKSEVPYKCHVFVAAPVSVASNPEWGQTKDKIEQDVGKFWGQFHPGIECVGVEVLRTDELTLADIDSHQRFDADWVSFADDSPLPPPAADMRE